MKSKDPPVEKLEINEEELFNILSHSTRRTIIRELKKQYYLTYSDFQIMIPQSPGVIYHHLEKMQSKGLIHQQENKQYKLTKLGIQASSFLEKLNDNDVPSLRIPSSPFHNLFRSIPLSKVIINNPLHLVIEINILTILLFLVQAEFSVLNVGPFLFPSEFPLSLKVFIEIIVFGVFFILFLFLSTILSTNSKDSFALVAGLSLLPCLSYLASFTLFLLSMTLQTIPPFIFWVIILILQVCYIYVMIHLLIEIKRLSLEKSVIISLIISYFLLGCTYILS